MATITGLTAERMLEIEAASVVDGDVVGNDLILARKDGSIINAGNLRGPAGPTGPMGSALSVVTAQQLLDVGQVGQIRAGRQLTPADFTNMGLSAPLGLWNLSNANDSSGNARHLTIKGGVPFGTGINGLASTAAVFSGSTAQALYIDAAGGSANFNIKTGSWGCWIRSSRRGILGNPMGKWAAVAGQHSFILQVNASNNPVVFISSDGTSITNATGFTDVVDDRFHFLVATHDGTKLILYVDGAFESSTNAAFPIFNGSAPLNFGGVGSDSGTTGISQFFGRIDEGFVTADVLSEEQVRNLYCASIPHALGSIPSSINMSVRRKRRGAPLAVTDFPSQPVRLYNLSNLNDLGSANQVLTGTNPNVGAVAGPDGSRGGATFFNGIAGTDLASTDAGLPSGLSPRSMGMWIKTISGNVLVMAYGSAGAQIAFRIPTSAITIVEDNGSDTITGPVVADGFWHHVVIVEDNAAADLVKRKLYVDGRVGGTSMVMNPITLGGANRFRIGSNFDGTFPFLGALRGVFVYAGALTTEQIRKLYDVGSQTLAPSPKVAADHIEAIETARLLATFDSIETNNAIDLAVMA